MLVDTRWLNFVTAAAYSLTSLFLIGFRLADVALVARQLLWREVIENEGDPIVGAFVHHAMVFLIIDLVSLPHLQAVRPAIDHEPYARVSFYGYVDSVPAMK